MITLLKTIALLSLPVFCSSQCDGDWTASYFVQQDDCLSQLARVYQTSVQEIIRRNPQVQDENMIQVGWELCVPSLIQPRRLPTKCVFGAATGPVVDWRARHHAGGWRKRRTTTAATTTTAAPAPLIEPASITEEAPQTPQEPDVHAVPPSAIVQPAPTAAPLPTPAPVASASASADINPNLVQCQFFDNGFASCLRTCSAAEFEYAVDAKSEKKILMRQCIENQPPTIHSWVVGDGVLARWLTARPAAKDEIEQIIAACTFSRDRTFACIDAFSCSDSTASQCTGGTRWKGRATEGDPLKDAAVLKGTITSFSRSPSGNSGTLPNGGRRKRASKKSAKPSRLADGFFGPETGHDGSIQCIYMAGLYAECQSGCDYDSHIVNLEPTGSMKIMMRECDPTTIVRHIWSLKDGILDPSVFPEKEADPDVLIAVCTMSPKNDIFECTGAAKCDPHRAGVDQCSGGLPWRGTRTGDPLGKDVVLTGKITAFAQNSNNGVSTPFTPVVNRKATHSPKTAITAAHKQAGPTPTTPTIDETLDRIVASEPVIKPPPPQSNIQAGDASQSRPQSPPIREDLQMCASAGKSCFFANGNGGLDSCLSHGGDLREPYFKTGHRSALRPEHKEIASQLVSSGLNRTECTTIGQTTLCKSYSSHDCVKQTDDGDQYNECGHQLLWTKEAGPQQGPACDVFKNYEKTCTVLKTFAGDKWTMTCYEPKDKGTSMPFQLVKSAEPIPNQIPYFVQRNPSVFKVECDMFESVYSCSAYSTATCSSLWDDSVKANVYSCGLQMYWLYPW